MERLGAQDISTLLIALGVMLGAARVLGELFKRWGQPSVLGEILAGILIGPTCLGRIAPGLFAAIFPAKGGAALALDGITTLAVTLFLLVAGMEVDLLRVWRQGRVAASISIAGIVVPFALGFGAALAAPASLGIEPQADRTIFALFFATALSISALPVIARTLLDLNLFRTDLGMLIVAAAIVQDIAGWIVFAVILGMLGTGHGHLSIGQTIGLTLAFAAFMLTAGRWLVHRTLPWIQAHASWPGGVLGFVLVVALFCAAFTEWVGVHAIFGTFLAGVAVGDSSHLRERTRTTIDGFISFIFAPLFFASVGLRVDFLASFEPLLVLIVLVIACAGKIAGCHLGGLLTGMPANERWAVSFGMNARGAMEIVLGLLALQNGVIGERLFVALVVMALVTSFMSGPLMQRALGPRRKARSFKEHLVGRGFVPQLASTTPEGAIGELARALAAGTNLDAAAITQALLAREQVMATGLGNELAVPNVRVEGLTAPVVGLGLSRAGIDFDAPDGRPARLVFVLLIPPADHDAQWGLLQDIARTFAAEEARDRAANASSFTELLAALNWGEHDAHEPAADGARKGVLIVGAGATARLIARKLAGAGTPVWLVDSNRDHCAAAQKEGLSIVQGNATRDVVLFQAKAFEARTLLALTPNAEVNAAVVAFARAEFRIPDVHALVTPGPVPSLPDLQGLFHGPTDLAGWDEWVADGAAQWVTAEVTEATTVAGFAARPPRDAAAGASGRLPRPEVGDAAAPPAPARPTLPVLVARGLETMVASPTLPLRPGDVVTSLVGPRDDVVRDRFDRAIEAAVVLDLDRPMTADAFARRAAGELAKHTALTAADLEQRLAERLDGGTTLLTPWLAVTRLAVPGADVFQALVARCKPGLTLPGHGGAAVRGLFVVAASDDARTLHLQALAAIAQLLQDPEFEERWSQAAAAGALRRLILESERPRGD